MVTFILISVVVVWVLFSGVVVVTASMCSSQFSQREALMAEHPASHERRFPEYVSRSESGRQAHLEAEKVSVSIQ